MDRVDNESVWLGCPGFTDEFVSRETFEGLQAPSEVVGGDEIREVAAEMIMALVVVSLDGSVLERPVHAFDLTIGPRMPGLRYAMVDVVLGASIFERIRQEAFSSIHHASDLGGGRADVSKRREVGAVVGQHGVDLVGHDLDEGATAARGWTIGG